MDIARAQSGVSRDERVAAIKAAAELVALKARVRELEASVTYALGCQAEALTAYNAAEQKLSDADALLREVDHTIEEEGPWLPLLYRIRAHLGAQPAAPRQTATECAHGRLRPGRLCPRCQLVGTR